MSGFEPLPLDFQSNASTKLASSPLFGGRPLLFHKVFTQAFDHLVRVDGFEPPIRADYQIYSLAPNQFVHNSQM